MTWGSGTTVPDGERTVGLAAGDLVEDALIRVDEDWRVVETNDRGATLLGRSAADVRGRAVWDVFPAVRDTDLPETLRAAAGRGEPRTAEATHPERGTRLEVHVYPTGEGLTVTVHERPDAGSRRARMVALADRPAFAVDDAGRFVDANDALADALDRDREAVLGEWATETVQGVAAALRQAITADVAPAGDLDPDSEAVETTRVTLNPGTPQRHRYEARVAPAPGEGAVCVLRDLSVPQGRRQRLAVLDRVLRHNLRTEMNVVRGRLRTVADAVDDPAADDALDAVDRSIDDLLSISRDVRRFADALDPELGDARPHDAVDAVETAVTEVRRRHPEAEVRLVVEDAVEMCAHESTLVAVEELVENAVVHTEASFARVTVSAVEAGDGPRTRIEVADDGDGIPDPERRVLTGGDETPLDHASGVGLWMVNWAVGKAGGHLSFSDPPEWGSIVTVDLPRPGPDGC